MYDALRAGAHGFLLKRTTAEDLVAGIRLVARGESLLFPVAARGLAAHHAHRGRTAALTARLTAREAVVLGLTARGLTNAEIAVRLAVGRHRQDARGRGAGQARGAGPHPRGRPGLRARCGHSGRRGTPGGEMRMS